MKDLHERFLDEIEDFKKEHCGHEVEITNDSVRFIGDWQATHEAWQFREWLEAEGYVAVYADGMKKTVAIIEEVEVPSWADLSYVNDEEIRLEAMGESIYCKKSNIEDGIFRLRLEMWERIKNVPGVGRSTLEALVDKFETPMHGLGQFQEVDGVGSSIAESLDDYVTLRI